MLRFEVDSLITIWLFNCRSQQHRASGRHEKTPLGEIALIHCVEMPVVFSETYLVRYLSKVPLFQCLNSFAISKATVRAASVLPMR